MRTLLACLLLFCSVHGLADDHRRLYQSAGWQTQRAHFGAALEAVRLDYRDSLPPAVFKALVANSEQRFAPHAMDERALQTLRAQLPDARPALAFYGSPLGQRIVAAETQATRPEQLRQHAGGLPRIEADSNRALLIRHLAQTLPASALGAEVSLALAGVAADSLSQMLPGLLGGQQTQGLLDSQRQRLVEQIEPDIDNTLLYVYRELSDAELEEYLTFARSPAGQAYYRAALEAVRAGLAVGRGTAELQRAP